MLPLIDHLKTLVHSAGHEAFAALLHGFFTALFQTLGNLLGTLIEVLLA
jgi:hypothetical protein